MPSSSRPALPIGQAGLPSRSPRLPRLLWVLPRLVDAMLGPEPQRCAVTLRFRHRQVGAQARALEAMVAEFNRLHPDATVEVVSPAQVEDVHPCLQEYLDPGMAPDLMEVDAGRLEAAAAADLLQELDGYLDDPSGLDEGGGADFLPGVLRAASRGGRLMAIPLGLPAAAGDGAGGLGFSVALLRGSPERCWLAWVFLRWLAAPEQAGRWCKASGQRPARRACEAFLAWPEQPSPQPRRRAAAAVEVRPA